MTTLKHLLFLVIFFTAFLHAATPQDTESTKTESKQISCQQEFSFLNWRYSSVAKLSEKSDELAKIYPIQDNKEATKLFLERLQQQSYLDATELLFLMDIYNNNLEQKLQLHKVGRKFPKKIQYKNLDQHLIKLAQIIEEALAAEKNLNSHWWNHKPKKHQQAWLQSIQQAENLYYQILFDITAQSQVQYPVVLKNEKQKNLSKIKEAAVLLLYPFHIKPKAFSFFSQERYEKWALHNPKQQYHYWLYTRWSIENFRRMRTIVYLGLLTYFSPYLYNTGTAFVENYFSKKQDIFEAIQKAEIYANTTEIYASIQALKEELKELKKDAEKNEIEIKEIEKEIQELEKQLQLLLQIPKTNPV